jgi:hypothetical protein
MPCIHVYNFFPCLEHPHKTFQQQGLGQSRALTNIKPTAHGTEPTAMSLDPLPANPTLDPAVCINTVQPKDLATEWQIGQ